MLFQFGICTFPTYIKIFMSNAPFSMKSFVNSSLTQLEMTSCLFALCIPLYTGFFFTSVLLTMEPCVKGTCVFVLSPQLNYKPCEGATIYHHVFNPTKILIYNRPWRKLYLNRSVDVFKLLFIPVFL